jgi:hypothetical protein
MPSFSSVAVMIAAMTTFFVASSPCHAFVSPAIKVTTASTTRSSFSSTILDMSSAAAQSPSSSTTATSSSSSSSSSFYTVQRVVGGEDDPRVVDIATFRNDMTNPQAVVERAQEKRDNLDTTKVALDGLKVGLFQVGPAVALASYFSAPETMTQDAAMMAAATNYGKQASRREKSRKRDAFSSSSSTTTVKGCGTVVYA